jgi:ribulose-5-phosphate 4-epimerase/fuculose-1-phosphate aldolase
MRESSMTTPANVLKFKPLRDRVSEAEWQTRVDLAACYRLMVLYGMTDLTANHITARVPGTKNEFLINPYGRLYDEITASSLYKIDLDGHVLLQPDVPYGINHAGYVIHSAIHGVRHDVECIVHTHTRAGVAVSCMAEGLMPINQTAMVITHDLAYHDFEGPALRLEERERLVADLGDHMHFMLRNHGLLTCGQSIAEAWVKMYYFESACRIQVDLMAAGAKLIQPSEEAHRNMAECMAGTRGRGELGALEWPTLLRKVDRLLPGYDQ